MSERKTIDGHVRVVLRMIASGDVAGARDVVDALQQQARDTQDGADKMMRIASEVERAFMQAVAGPTHGLAATK